MGGLDTGTKLVLYFLHERVWDKFRFGRKPIDPAVVWFTGLTRSGKTAISRQVAVGLMRKGVKVEYLNGETVRDLFPATGFSRAERDEHIKRVGYLASRLERNGVFGSGYSRGGRALDPRHRPRANPRMPGRFI